VTRTLNATATKPVRRWKRATRDVPEWQTAVEMRVVVRAYERAKHITGTKTKAAANRKRENRMGAIARSKLDSPARIDSVPIPFL
jgi:hypothetical protein